MSGRHSQLTLRTHPVILVAEDSNDTRDMMRVALGLKGYRVLSARDGFQAIQIAVKRLPDMILVDLQLPKLDGLDVTRKVRQHPGLSTIPIVMISGHDPAQHRQTALDAGCTDYLLKPIDFRLLDKILQTSVPLT